MDEATGQDGGEGTVVGKDGANPLTAALGLDGNGKGPLAGIVVADLSRVLAGPYCTMLLADLGATVIKVESPGGDDTRTWRPPVHGDMATYFMAANRNKHSIALDMKDPEQLELVHRIVGEADVLVENFKPGGLAKYGLDADSVAQRWPHLVHASITGFGTAGGAHLPGYDMLIQGVSGFMSLTGEADGPPQKGGVAMMDVMTGLHCALAILAALRERDASGRGQHVELNLFMSALSGLVNQTSAYVAGGAVPRRMGNDHPSLFPYGPFACRDTDLIICVGNDRQFARLAEVLGVPELAEDEKFATMSGRNEHRDELRARMVERLGERDAQQWQDELVEVGVPCAPILGVDEGIEYAQKLGLDPVADTGGVPTVRHPVDYSRTPARHVKAPPRLDEDREAVLAWLEGRGERRGSEGEGLGSEDAGSEG